MDPTTSVKDIIDLIGQVYTLIKDQVEAYKNINKAATELEQKVKRFGLLIEPTLQNQKEHPIYSHLQDFQQTLDDIKHDIQIFVDEEEAFVKEYDRKSKWKRLTLVSKYKVKRAAKASGLQQVFETSSMKIDFTTQQLKLVFNVNNQLVQGSVTQFYNTMLPEAFKFWKRINNNYLTTYSLSWSQFIASYKLYYKDAFDSDQWDDRILNCMKDIACVKHDDGMITVAGYRLLTEKCGFPLDPAKLPSALQAPVLISDQTRSHVVTSINELIEFFATETMRQYLFIVRSWYDGYAPEDRQERANAWATAMRKLGTKKKCDWTSDDYKVDTVDMARRTIFFFYHRFAILLEVNQLSKDLFKKVDFPGKPRLYHFLDYVKPLDRANYGTMPGKKASDWDTYPSKVPEVYKFVQNYVNVLEQEKKKTIIASSSPSITVTAAEAGPSTSTSGVEQSTSSSSSNSLTSTSVKSEPTTISTTATTISSHHQPVNKSIVDNPDKLKTHHGPTVITYQVDLHNLFTMKRAVLALPVLVIIMSLLEIVKTLFLSPLLYSQV